MGHAPSPQLLGILGSYWRLARPERWLFPGRDGLQQGLQHQPGAAVGLINYGERYRSGERISSCLAESTVNVVISKRFAKRQQM